MPAAPTRRHVTCAPHLQRGLTLVDLLCALSICMVLLGGALPMFNELRQGQRLMAVAALLETDIHLARSTAISTGQPVRLLVQTGATGGSCYVLVAGPTDTCTCTDLGQARCESGLQPLRVEGQPVAAGVTLAALTRPLTFDGRKATVTPTATLRLSGRDGRSIHQVVNIMGRVRSCAPGTAIGGLRSCA